MLLFFKITRLPDRVSISSLSQLEGQTLLDPTITSEVIMESATV